MLDEKDDDPDGTRYYPVSWAEDMPFPGTWYAVAGNPKGHTSRAAWTVSPDPEKPGWATDDGTGGYGMPRAVAQELARRVNLPGYVDVTVVNPAAEGRQMNLKMLAPPRVGEVVQFGDPVYWGVVAAVNWVSSSSVVVRISSPAAGVPEASDQAPSRGSEVRAIFPGGAERLENSLSQLREILSNEGSRATGVVIFWKASDGAGGEDFTVSIFGSLMATDVAYMGAILSQRAATRYE